MVMKKMFAIECDPDHTKDVVWSYKIYQVSCPLNFNFSQNSIDTCKFMVETFLCVTKELTVRKALLCYCHFLAKICMYFENLFPH